LGNRIIKNKDNNGKGRKNKESGRRNKSIGSPGKRVIEGGLGRKVVEDKKEKENGGNNKEEVPAKNGVVDFFLPETT